VFFIHWSRITCHQLQSLDGQCVLDWKMYSPCRFLYTITSDSDFTFLNFKEHSVPRQIFWVSLWITLSPPFVSASVAHGWPHTQTEHNDWTSSPLSVEIILYFDFHRYLTMNKVNVRCWLCLTYYYTDLRQPCIASE